jgi:hypothetical protein
MKNKKSALLQCGFREFQVRDSAPVAAKST